MIFYLTIEPDKELTHIPHIDSIYINLNGKSVCCTWDETDASKDKFIYYRFKGVYFDDKYANGILNTESCINIEEINYQEDDNAEEFKINYLSLVINDGHINKTILIEGE